MVAAAHVHTIKTHGPDRCAGFSPIPAMSMVSHCVGTRFIQLIGGVMTSFYDWYADLPVASPQVFGDQTDVPESGDWWDATYLMMWGSNVPVTRTPDAHWMAEVRYRGTKVVTVSPGLRRQHQVRRRVDARPGRHRRGARDGHGPRAAQGVLRRPRGRRSSSTTSARYTDLPFLVTLEERTARTAPFVPGKFLTAADLGRRGRRPDEDAWKTVLLDGATGQPVVPNGSMGFRYADSGKGRWNLDLEGVDAPR